MEQKTTFILVMLPKSFLSVLFAFFVVNILCIYSIDFSFNLILFNILVSPLCCAIDNKRQQQQNKKKFSAFFFYFLFSFYPEAQRGILLVLMGRFLSDVFYEDYRLGFYCFCFCDNNRQGYR